MQGQKNIIVVDNDAARRFQIETVLSFVGEHFIVCQDDEVTQKFASTANVLTVILCGKITDSLAKA